MHLDLPPDNTLFGRLRPVSNVFLGLLMHIVSQTSVRISFRTYELNEILIPVYGISDIMTIINMLDTQKVVS